MIDEADRMVEYGAFRELDNILELIFGYNESKR